MLKTQKTDYRVAGVQRTHIWLEVLHGDDHGTRVSVPLYDSETPEDVQARLHQLTTNDVISAQLESSTTSPPNWRVTEFSPSET